MTSSSHCLSPAYKGVDYDPTAGVKGFAKDEAEKKSC